ncbi:MAG: ABC transporter ATP-binding protein [Bacilli bacterium]|nr:ABC transporter ATP-binding protein [Bacilli bacterium]
MSENINNIINENTSQETSIRFENITKRFGEVWANKNVTFEMYKGEILSLLGENGSGKTTLMNMLSGIYYPDDGNIYVKNQLVSIKSPRDAFKYGIGMIHQHFKLVDVFTCIENIVLGIEDKEKAKISYAKEICQQICDKYGFIIDLNKKVYDMSVSEKQTLEIIKVLYRGADILILDEPTAVLTPSEIQRLFNVLRNMRDDGKSIIIITHKLNEVMEISSRVVVLRKGECIGSVLTSTTNEKQLTEMMVGEKIDLNIQRDEPVNPEERLIVKNLSCRNKDGIKVLDNVSFTAYSGKILGIAGISGSGQREVLESIAGLIKLETGDINYFDPKDHVMKNLRNRTPMQIRDLGVRLSFVPEDRLGMGLVGNMDIIDNMMLRSYQKGYAIFVDRDKPKKLGEKIIESLQVKTPSINTQVRKLSGGNVQKVLVGREIAASPKVLMAAYPVRGLDINSAYTIYNLLNEQKNKGVAVIFVGEDLDVLLALCDDILVLGEGKVRGIVDARNSSKEEVGIMMTKSNYEKESDIHE